MRVEDRTILLAVATGSRRTATVAPSATELDWDRLHAQLDRARLMPTLGPRLEEMIVDVPARFAEKVADARSACLRQDALLGLVADQLVATLAARGVRATTLKGPHLGERLYGEAGRRLSSDIDLLVAPGDLQRACDAVRELGYAAPTDSLGSNGLPLLHLVLEHPEGTLPPVEVHWRIHWYESLFAAERLLPPATGANDWRPEPVDELAAILLFYARDGFTGLRQASDLSAWWDRFGDSVEAGAMADLGNRYPELRDAWLASLNVAERVVGLPAARLGADRNRLGARAKAAVRLADPRPYASEEQMFAEIGLIDGLLAPARTLPAFVRRQVAPPRALLRERAGKAREARLVSPLGHCVRVLGRFALAFGRLLRVPFAYRARFPS